MADITQSVPTHAPFFQRIMETIAEYGASTRRAQELQRLCEMSDAQLAARGLTRETIALHVFRGAAHI